MSEYKALAGRIGKQADELAAFGHHTSEQRVADLRTVVTMLNEMAEAKPQNRADDFDSDIPPF